MCTVWSGGRCRWWSARNWSVAPSEEERSSNHSHGDRCLRGHCSRSCYSGLLCIIFEMPTATPSPAFLHIYRAAQRRKRACAAGIRHPLSREAVWNAFFNSNPHPCWSKVALIMLNTTLFEWTWARCPSLLSDQTSGPSLLRPVAGNPSEEIPVYSVNKKLKATFGIYWAFIQEPTTLCCLLFYSLLHNWAESMRRLEGKILTSSVEKWEAPI